jgi:transcription initiation factor TFIIE subunit alpha
MARKELDPILKSYIYLIGGEICVEVSSELLNSEEEFVSAEEIAENIIDRVEGEKDYEPEEEEVLRVKTVRKLIFKLQEEGLARSRKNRSSDGYYSFSYRDTFDAFPEMLFQKIDLIQEKLRARFEYEKNNSFFVCKECDENKRFRFEDAYEYNFRCLDCGGPLETEENDEIIAFLKKKMIQNRNWQEYLIDRDFNF